MIKVANIGIVAFVVTAMAIIATQEASVKLLTEHVSIWQLHVIRSILVIGFAFAAGRFIAGLEVRRLESFKWALIRSLLFSTAFFLLYSGLPFLSLAQSGAVFFTAPLFITLFAALFLGESIGPRRVAALVLGFSGVLVTAQPWNETINAAILFPLCGALAYAGGVMVTRGRCNSESALSLQVAHHSIFGVISLIGLIAVLIVKPDTGPDGELAFLLGGWSSFGLVVALLIVANALTNFVGAFMLTYAYQNNEASGIAPLEYSYLAVAPILDMLIWGALPGWSTLIGIILVASSGVFIAIRSAEVEEAEAA